MNQRVGTCSICGGDVHGYRGTWMSISPPPPDKCISCGAVSSSDVIRMFKPFPFLPNRLREPYWSNKTSHTE